MNNGLFIFLGILVTLTLSWAATVLSPQKQEGLGQLMPYYDINEDKSFPRPMSGLAEQGQKVYQDLGCVYCHTQQVRRSGYGNDVGAGSRNWGERQSVARDYIQQDRVQLGSLRVGQSGLTKSSSNSGPSSSARKAFRRFLMRASI